MRETRSYFWLLTLSIEKASSKRMGSDMFAAVVEGEVIGFEREIWDCGLLLWETFLEGAGP
jgi:hypothetical protein